MFMLPLCIIFVFSIFPKTNTWFCHRTYTYYIKYVLKAEDHRTANRCWRQRAGVGEKQFNISAIHHICTGNDACWTLAPGRLSRHVACAHVPNPETYSYCYKGGKQVWNVRRFGLLRPLANVGYGVLLPVLDMR